MSIFITNLAFDEPGTITTSKMSILFASMSAAVIGLFVLRKKKSKQPEEKLSGNH
jgi:Na+/H+ antiporter NhaA